MRRAPLLLLCPLSLALVGQGCARVSSAVAGLRERHQVHTEAGTFDVVTANTVNMWMSASFSVINKLAADSLAITWTLTFS